MTITPLQRLLRPRNTSSLPPLCGAWSIGFAALSILLCVIEIAVGYNVPDSPSAWMYFGMIILAIVLFAVVPLYGALCIIMCWQIGYYVPFHTLSMLIVIGLVLMVFLGIVSLPIAMAISFISTIYEVIAVYTDVSNASIDGIMLFSSTMVALSAIGFGIRRYREYHAFLTQRERQRHSNRVIADLHDSVCNDLNFALIQLEAYEAATDPNIRQDQLRHAHDGIMRALAKTRAVLDTLQDDAHDSVYIGITGNIPLLALIREQRQRLQEAGFSGILLVPNSDDANASITADDDRATVIAGFIRETVNNIINHADSTCEYIMVIGIRGDTLHIEVSDTPRPESPRHRTGGTGLNFYRNRIESLGGTITIQQEPHLWLMQAVIPLSEITMTSGDEPNVMPKQVAKMQL